MQNHSNVTIKTKTETNKQKKKTYKNIYRAAKRKTMSIKLA